ncbi:MAG: flagellar biosynthesis protein FlhA [Pseudomonadales bacterium]|nr:flagellar biosynthesis protein FlhA [Pseudomonadales bacterium]
MSTSSPALNNMATKGNFGAPIILLITLAMMTLPIPPILLDVFFSFNIALALVVLLVTVYAMKPLDFAVFPTIILIATLLRLALNVASTRVVLLHGHSGGDAAGSVIEAFGEVVIGGNYAVGIVVFAILVIINFVVVTKGAGRISEVSARFTLDAMPGKQMAIDADLNAGLIDQDDAKARRVEIAAEADFYGSMDGASKFVRGDALAGILILIINIIGGLIIGMAQHGLDFASAMERYALLTIGDGLVAQIPSLLLSTASAIMVTRVNSEESMGEQVINQMFTNPQALIITSFVLFVMGIVPGMPHFAFLSFSGLCGIAAYVIASREKEIKPVSKKPSAGPAAVGGSPPPGGGGLAPVPEATEGELVSSVGDSEVKELSWDDVQAVDMLGLEVGYRIIPLVDKSQGGHLLNRIKGIRKKLSQELGFLMPSVHIRDNLDLVPNAYRITLMGVPIDEAEIHPDRELAINPGQVFGTITGIAGKDPAFGLDAVWIESSQKDQAQTMGYTVVDASTVVATHLNQVMQKHSHELLGHEEVQKLIEQLEKSSPKLVESIIPAPLNVSILLRVLQNLLKEGVPIRDIRTIAEALADASSRSQDPDVLTSVVRVALSRLISQTLVGVEEDLAVITLQPDLEQLLLQSVQQARQTGGSASDAVLEPSMADKLLKSVLEAGQKQELAGKPAILLVSSAVRTMMARFVRTSMPTLSVLAYNEIPDSKQITIVATVGA